MKGANLVVGILLRQRILLGPRTLLAVVISRSRTGAASYRSRPVGRRAEKKSYWGRDRKRSHGQDRCEWLG